MQPPVATPSFNTTTTRHRTHARAMTTLFRSSSFEYFSSRQESTNKPRNVTPGPSNVPRTPTSNTTPENWCLWTMVLDGPFNDPWASTENAVPDPDPAYPVGSWDQPGVPPDVPGFSATDLGLEPEVITIHDTDSEPVPPYRAIQRNGPRVVIPHPD